MALSDRLEDALWNASFLLGTLLYALLAALSPLWPRRDDLWVFGARGGADFVDNAKYLFTYVNAADPDVRAVWLTKNPGVATSLQRAGYEAYRARSLRGVWLNLRAGTAFLTQGLRDVNMPCLAGAFVVQLWHGIPLKTIGWDAEIAEHSLPVRAAHAYLADSVDVVTITAEALRTPFASGLRVPPERMAVTGYPRHDGLLGRLPDVDDDGRTDALRERPEDAFVFYYLPTFRGGDGAPLDENLDLAGLDRTMASIDAHLVVKFHPDEPIAVEETLDRVTVVPESVDVYPLLKRADALLTDYSSVLFDFLLLDRPVAFYAYDLTRYRDDRGFYFDYEAVTPGPVATDLDELRAALRSIRDGDGFAAERRAVRDRFLHDPDRCHSAAVVETVRERR